MQNIYINGLQIHSNVTDLGFVVYMPILGLEFPNVRFSPYDKPGEHGSILPSSFYSGRTITINGRISGNTPSQYLLNRRTLTNILRILLTSLNTPTPLLLQFLTLDGLSLQANCFLSKMPTLTDRSLNHGLFTIELFAEDPYLYDQNIQTNTINMPSGGGATYPVIYPVTYAAKTGGQLTLNNAGDADTYPIITLYGPLTSPIINNVTLGTTFVVNLTLNSGDVLVIDMAKKTMVLNGITNAMQYFNLNNTWLTLQPGNNLFSLSSSLSSDSGYMTVSFRNAYIGV